ncbi:hypothetical protein LTR85_006847 [Meristemomyces frigidus]|nr:hypothetical protein LTR85_006847 [Meristemomyces frigidus]
MPAQTRSAALAAGLATAPSSHAPQTHKSPLLSLPPELRNAIYRFATVGANELIIDPQQLILAPPEPGLLSVCKQIRKEASGLYYRENLFLFSVRDFDASLYVLWCSASKLRKQCHQRFLTSGSNNWSNLLAWLEAYYHKRCRSVGGGAPSVPHHLFQIVKDLGHKQGMSWECVAGNLEHFHQALKVSKGSWQ